MQKGKTTFSYKIEFLMFCLKVVPDLCFLQGFLLYQMSLLNMRTHNSVNIDNREDNTISVLYVVTKIP